MSIGLSNNNNKAVGLVVVVAVVVVSSRRTIEEYTIDRFKIAIKQSSLLRMVNRAGNHGHGFRIPGKLWAVPCYLARCTGHPDPSV